MANVSGAAAQGAAEATIQAQLALDAAAKEQELQKVIQGAIGIAKHDAAKLNAMLGIGVFLTVDELFAFAQQQLKSSDSDIRNMMNDVSVKRDHASALGNLAASARAAKAKSSIQDQLKELNDAIDAGRANGLTDEEMKDVIDLQLHAQGRVEGTGKYANEKGQGKLQNESSESAVKVLDQAAQDLTSSVDLSMIRIQSLVQQRNQTLTMISNVMAAINEPIKTAISNMRGG